jgi:hypothetical protein
MFNVLTYASARGSFDKSNLPALAAGSQWVELTSPTHTALKVVGPSPSLTVTMSDSGLSLSWPADADSGYALQYTTNLFPPILWQTATNATQVVGNQNVVTIPTGDGAVYFQLRE